MKPEEVEHFREQMRIEGERRGPPEDFPLLPPIPSERYRSQAFADLEREYVWLRTWLLAAHLDEIPEPGDYRLWSRLGCEVLIVMGEDGLPRAFHNVCQHRGRALVSETSGNASRFVCPFHAWAYDATGELVGLPDEGDFRGLDRERCRLPVVRCEVWGRFVFINFDAAAQPLLDFLGGIPREMEQFGPGELRFLGRQTHRVSCNWKTATDAFVEVHHLSRLHGATGDDLLDYHQTTIGLLRSGHSRMVTAKRAEARDARLGTGAPLLPGLSDLPREANLSYFLFPNTHNATDLAGFPFLQLWPLGLTETEIEVSWVVGDWGEGPPPQHWLDAVKIFDVVLRENLPNLEAVTRALDSPGAQRMQLGYQERRILHHHAQLDAMIGHARIPEGLAVYSPLGSWLETRG